MATALYLCSALFSDVVYFAILMDLNKVYIYTVAHPNHFPRLPNGEKEDDKSSHELNRYNGATCWLVLVIIV